MARWPGTHLSQADPHRVHDVRAFPAEVRVWFVLDDEDDVSRDGAERLVALPGERDLGSLFPATLDLDGEDLVLCAHGAAVGVQPLAGDLHALGAAMEDLLQGDAQLVVDGGVLLAVGWPGATVPLAGEAVQAEAAEGSKGLTVHLHVLVVPPAGCLPAEEHLEGVGPAEEGGEGGMGVPVECVGVAAPLAIRGAPSSLQT